MTSSRTHMYNQLKQLKATTLPTPQAMERIFAQNQGLLAQHLALLGQRDQMSQQLKELRVCKEELAIYKKSSGGALGASTGNITKLAELEASNAALLSMCKR